MSAMRERVCARVFARVCVHRKRKQVMGEYLNACRDGNRVCLCVCVCLGDEVTVTYVSRRTYDILTHV